MIEQFLVFSQSGSVLFKYQARRVPESVINNFISNTLISQRENLVGINNGEGEDEDDEVDDDSVVSTYNGDGYSIKYIKTSVPTLYFTLAFPSVMHLHNTEDLLLKLKTLFVEMFEDEVEANLKESTLLLIDFESDEYLKFAKFFEIQLQNYNKSEKESAAAVAAASASTTTNENSEGPVSTPVATPSSSKKQILSKKLRKWGADGSIVDNNGAYDDDGALDFSVSSASETAKASKASLLKIVGDQSTFGNKSKTGEFLVSDLGEEMDRILLNSTTKSKKDSQSSAAQQPQSLGFLRNFIGGKTITKEEIQKTTQLLTNHLIKKNVAPEVARNLISSVEKSLIGSTTKSFTSLDQTCKEALTNALTTLLTPNTSINLLNEIQAKRRLNQPYVISVVGVNGVGKSTNLSKLAFWLLQNNYRVLITACDTFRSGAVEQLRVHVNNLKQLTADSETPSVELFEGGYGGADLVAKIAKGAIKYAHENQFDIVLMDTAGRRHNDTKLMAPLLNFAKAANPDKIIMVGEALVGTDSVLQAQNFNKLFGVNRKLDCFIISKCDTVGDLIGSMVNMVYATGIPILFVGIGQTYTDLRTLSVDWAVNMLMS